MQDRCGGVSVSSFFREVDCSGKTLRVKQLYVGDVGCVVWDAALVLCRFLENKQHFPKGFWHGKNVVDLGSGTGVVGLAAGTLGANVFVTDLPDFVELMASNVELNKDCITGSVMARPLTWGQDVSDIQSPAVILMSDVVYYREVLDDLVKTLVDLSSVDTVIIMSYEERTTGDKPDIEKLFFQMMSREFTHTVVPLSEQDADFSSPDIHIFIFKREQEKMEMDWKVLGLGFFAGVAATGTIIAGCKLWKCGTQYKLRKSYLATDPLSLYVNGQNCEDAVLGRLRSVSTQHSKGRMTTGLTVGRLLSTLTKSLGARKVMDVGVFTGCSSYAMALALPEGGTVVACDVSEEFASIGKPFWKEGGVSGKIDLHIQPATKTLQDLIDNGESGTFDLIFIDADKLNYPQYYEMGLELLRKGGLVVIDNALWSGRVADPACQDENTLCIRALNSQMQTDTRVEYVLLDISDGVGVACKK